MNVELARPDRGFGDARRDGLMGDSAQRDGPGPRSQAGVVPEQHGVEQVNDCEVGELRYRDVGEFLGCVRDVQGGTDVRTCPV
jgi:hypothetical protein